MTQPTSASAQIHEGAALLATAEVTRKVIRPLTELFPQLSVQDAYHIQKLNIRRRIEAGERITGHKIGLTAATMRELFGVHEPDYGHLMNTMIHEPDRPLDLSELIDPQVEVEPGFVLRRPLGGADLGIADVLEATDYICVCLEIIDSRIADWRIKIQDTGADNGSSARVVIGTKRIDPRSLTLDNLETSLDLHGQRVETGNTSAIMGHPAKGIAWLAKALAAFDIVLQPGDLVLPGTCTRSRHLTGHRSAVGRIAGLGALIGVEI